MHGTTQHVFEFLTGLGWVGLLLGLVIEIIPSEIVLAYGGYMIYKGEMNFPEAIIAGLVGGIIAQLIIYWIGKYGGRPFVLKFGKYFFIKEKQVELADKWFKKYGNGVVFTARFIPVVRHAISIPAGITKMNIGKFILFTGIASIPWSILFLYLGMSLGKHWSEIDQKATPYTIWFLVAAIVIAIFYAVVKTTKKVQKKVPM